MLSPADVTATAHSLLIVLRDNGSDAFNANVAIIVQEAIVNNRASAKPVQVQAVIKRINGQQATSLRKRVATLDDEMRLTEQCNEPDHKKRRYYLDMGINAPEVRTMMTAEAAALSSVRTEKGKFCIEPMKLHDAMLKMAHHVLEFEGTDLIERQINAWTCVILLTYCLCCRLNEITRFFGKDARNFTPTAAHFVQLGRVIWFSAGSRTASNLPRPPFYKVSLFDSMLTRALLSYVFDQSTLNSLCVSSFLGSKTKAMTTPISRFTSIMEAHGISQHVETIVGVLTPVSFRSIGATMLSYVYDTTELQCCDADSICVAAKLQLGHLFSDVTRKYTANKLAPHEALANKRVLALNGAYLALKAPQPLA